MQLFSYDIAHRRINLTKMNVGYYTLMSFDWVNHHEKKSFDGGEIAEENLLEEKNRKLKKNLNNLKKPQPFI